MCRCHLTRRRDQSCPRLREWLGVAVGGDPHDLPAERTRRLGVGISSFIVAWNPRISWPFEPTEDLTKRYEILSRRLRAVRSWLRRFPNATARNVEERFPAEIGLVRKALAFLNQNRDVLEFLQHEAPRTIALTVLSAMLLRGETCLPCSRAAIQAMVTSRRHQRHSERYRAMRPGRPPLDANERVRRRYARELVEFFEPRVVEAQAKARALRREAKRSPCADHGVKGCLCWRHRLLFPNLLRDLMRIAQDMGTRGLAEEAAGFDLLLRHPPRFLAKALAAHVAGLPLTGSLWHRLRAIFIR